MTFFSNVHPALQTKSCAIKNNTYKILGIILLVMLVGGGYYYFAGSKTTEVQQQTVSARIGKALATVSATGTIKPVNSVEISSKITALIKEVKVKENEIVKAGQTLVILEDKELSTKLDQARYKVNSTKTKYERIKKLYTIGAKSDQELEDAELDYNTAVSSYEGVMSNVEDTIIISPQDGVVIGEPLTAGTLVAQGVNNPKVIMKIADLSKKQITAKVDETDIGKVQVGQKATFTVDAYANKTFEAIVSNISQTDINDSWSKDSTASSSANAGVIYYNVTLDVDDIEGLLKPAMTARLNINVGERDNVILIPLAALKTNNEGQYVILQKENGTTENVKVEVGLYSGEEVEIKSGLNEGDKLVVSYIKQQEKSSQQTPKPRI